MTSQINKATEFKNLHIKGSPIIIYNAWDAGSAKSIAKAGAKAIATGDHPVGFAHGFGDDDFTDFTFDMYLVTIKEIAKRVGNLPLSIDINNANELVGSALMDRVKTVIDAGAVGINFEDSFTDGSGVQTIDEQVDRIKTIRIAADELSVPLFINARTDIFAQSDPVHHKKHLDEAVERAAAFKNAGADGFFVPGLLDLKLIKKLVESVELPVNIIKFPGSPTTKELAEVGVSRISYGPVPQIAMSNWLVDQAMKAIRGEI